LGPTLQSEKEFWEKIRLFGWASEGLAKPNKPLCPFIRASGVPESKEILSILVEEEDPKPFMKHPLLGLALAQGLPKSKTSDALQDELTVGMAHI
jgi:hypothetical protein